MEAKKRQLYIDNIRLFVIILVVIMHLSVTYSNMGSWYYTEGRFLSGGEGTFFSFTQTFLQAFFMGFLFLIAGYFVPGAYDRKGFSLFLRNRVIRLGIPALLFMFVVDPFTEYVLLGSHTPGQGFLSFYAENITSLHILSGSGPLWFALALLAFTVVYAVVRRATGKTWGSSPRKIVPNAAVLVILVLVIALSAYLIRIRFPIITSVSNMMLCFFAQYIVLFIAGILAYRYDLFSKLSRSCMGLLYTSPLWAFGVWAALMMAAQAFWRSDYALFNGGGTWQSLIFALWESFTAVAMCAGLLVLFREYFNTQNRLTRALSSSSFSVYVFHTPIIVAITLLFQPVDWPPFIKYAVMIPICLPICFAVSYVLTKVPLLKKIL